MILPDHQIHILCKEGMVKPYNRENLNPASLDITIGSSLKIMRVKPLWYPVYLLDQLIQCDTTANWLSKFVYWQTVSLWEHDKEKPFWLRPGDRILVQSYETFNIPNNICATFHLKSSIARQFYEHLQSVFCHPGWHGSVLTMELEAKNLAPLPIYMGMAIGQLTFSRLEDLPHQSYSLTGKYNNDSIVQESKP